MYAEFKSRRKSSSFVAKSMGLEGRPSSPFVHMNHGEMVSTGIQRLRQLYDGKWSRRHSLEQQQFEYSKGSHVVEPRFLSRRIVNSTPFKPEMTSVPPKFESSKELYDTTEWLLDSKEKSLLKIPAKGNSLFLKHMHDLQGHRLSTLGEQITVLKPSTSKKYDPKLEKSQSDTASKSDISCHLKFEDCAPQTQTLHNNHRSYVSPLSSNIELDEKNVVDIFPTRIVVLKPNLEKTWNYGTANSSPDHLHGYLSHFKKIKECSAVGGASRMRDSISINPLSKEGREISREISGHAKVDCDENHHKSSGCGGYAGDESSCDVYDSDPDSESEMFKFSSRNFLLVDKSLSSSTLAESYFNTEAKKRILERWTRTCKYEDVEIPGKGRTLGELLAVADEKENFKYFNAKTSNGMAWNKFGHNNGSQVGGHPLGIDSRDDWKNKTNHTLHRTRCFPRSIDDSSHRKSSYNKTLTENNHSSCRADLWHGTSGGMVKKTPSRNEKFSNKNSKPRINHPLPYQKLIINGICSTKEPGSETQMEEYVIGLSGQQPMFQMGAMDENFQSLASDKSSTFPLKSSELCPKHLISAVNIDKFASHDLDGFSLKFEAKPDSSECSKEGDHHSPVSVLCAPFAEHISSASKNFKRVKAEIIELQRQLHLLKKESGSNAAVSTLGPMEDNSSQLCSLFSKKANTVEHDCWPISYTLDVLLDSGLEEPGTCILGKGHSPGFPLDAQLFNHLEKKHSSHGQNRLRSQRRLLFDTINLRLLEMFQQQVAPHSTQQKDGIIDVLVKFINNESAKGEISEKLLDGETIWSGSKGEMDFIGMEIEKLLIDNLVAEVLYN